MSRNVYTLNVLSCYIMDIVFDIILRVHLLQSLPHLPQLEYPYLFPPFIGYTCAVINIGCTLIVTDHKGFTQYLHLKQTVINQEPKYFWMTQCGICFKISLIFKTKIMLHNHPHTMTDMKFLGIDVI